MSRYPSHEALNKMAGDAHEKIVKACFKRGETPPAIVVILSEPEYCAVARSIGEDAVKLAIKRAARQLKGPINVRKAVSRTEGDAK
jgi:hypothetical protein